MIDLIKRARLMLGFLSSEEVMDRLVRCGHDPSNVFLAVRGAEVLVTAELLDEPFETNANPQARRRAGASQRKVMTMTNDTILSRNPDDGRRYKVTYLGHWSRIVNVADEDDFHYVKWYGGCPVKKKGLYVSQPAGVSFVTVQDR